MAGKENLRPVSSTEEARERGRKGGLASVEARRKRKTLKEELLLMLSDGDIQEKISLALINEAINGNNAGSVTKAFEVLRDTIGERPVERSAHTIVGVEALQAMSDAELVQLAESGATGGGGDGAAG